jgi:peptidoglycan-associated lipoprotein
MKKNYWLVLALVFILPVMMLTVSCAKKAVEAEPATEEMQEEQPMEEPAEEPADTSMSEDEMASDQEARSMEAARQMFESENIYFEFDSSALLRRDRDHRRPLR